MKSKSTHRHILAIAGSSLLAVSSTYAGQIWDGTGSKQQHHHTRKLGR
jgi:hypothetical protein